MIRDKEHSELRNLMTPVVNYFAMAKHYYETDCDSQSESDRLWNLMRSEESKIINDVLPNVKKILNVEAVSEEKFCSRCGKRKKSKGDGTIELLCEC